MSKGVQKLAARINKMQQLTNVNLL